MGPAASPRPSPDQRRRAVQLALKRTTYSLPLRLRLTWKLRSRHARRWAPVQVALHVIDGPRLLLMHPTVAVGVRPPAAAMARSAAWLAAAEVSVSAAAVAGAIIAAAAARAVTTTRRFMTAVLGVAGAPLASGRPGADRIPVRRAGRDQGTPARGPERAQRTEVLVFPVYCAFEPACETSCLCDC